jgi:hypothetical protein
MATGESTYKCGTYVKQLLSLRDDNTPVCSLRSASTSETGKKMLSPNREPVLAELESDSHNVQIEKLDLTVFVPVT